LPAVRKAVRSVSVQKNTEDTGGAGARQFALVGRETTNHEKKNLEKTRSDGSVKRVSRRRKMQVKKGECLHD